MEGEKEIIYLAICNQIQIYSLLLEQEDLGEENRGMANYIIQISTQVEEKLREELQKDKPISRPPWSKIE